MPCPQWGNRLRQLWKIPSVMVFSGGGLLGIPAGGLLPLDALVRTTPQVLQSTRLTPTSTATKNEFLQRAPSRQATDLWLGVPLQLDLAEPTPANLAPLDTTPAIALPILQADTSTLGITPGSESWDWGVPTTVAEPTDSAPETSPIYRTPFQPTPTQSEIGDPDVVSRRAEVINQTGETPPMTVLLDTPLWMGDLPNHGQAIAPPSLNFFTEPRSRVASTAPIAADPGNPSLPPLLPCANPDPELGCLLLDGTIQDKPPILYLTPRVDFFRSNNLLLGIVPISDGLVRSSISLLAVPPLDANTFLLAGIEGAFSRYFKVPIYNYDELKVRAGILRRLSPTMTAELAWIHQQLYIASNEIPSLPYGSRFFMDHTAQLTLSRQDAFSDRLSLNSIYQLRWGFAEPTNLSRLFNVLFLSLNYNLNRQRTMQVGLDYQFSAATYTEVQRTDIYQQILGRISMQVVRNTKFSLYGGLSFGSSTAPTVDFNGVVLGISLAVNLGLL